jgi:uncharacterized damage-inducible protein DinB
MTEMTSKTQLVHMLKVSNQRVIDWFTAITVEDFFIRYRGEWSALENVDHLIKAHKPVAKALKLPKIILRTMFGKPDRASLTYEELCKAYRDEIAKGAQASGRYLPSQENLNSGTERRKNEFLDQFLEASKDLVSAAEKWDDKELDDYFLPHPILGKLTIREILYFTVYHNLRHASQEGD